MAFGCFYDFGEIFLDCIVSEVRSCFKAAIVDGFEECLYGRTECIFVIELGKFYFCVARNAGIRSVLICW